MMKKNITYIIISCFLLPVIAFGENKLFNFYSYYQPITPGDASVQQIAGYMDVGFTDSERAESKFFIGHFNPIFQFLYKQSVFAEAELEVEIEDGNTEIKLEYANIGLFINDYVSIIAGKLLSPLGYFIQNLHPSWINRLPTNPAGFRSRQASPMSDIGLQLRGAIPITDTAKITYAGYVANGPFATIDANGFVQMINHSGYNQNDVGHKLIGGRIAIKPFYELELGVSGAVNQIGLYLDDALAYKSNYHAYGADATVTFGDLRLRGEVIAQNVATRNSKMIYGGTWKAGYVQAEYRFYPTGFETVVRYGKYETPFRAQNAERTAFGINYWLWPNTVIKTAYELSNGQKGTVNNDDAFHAQLAFGF